MTPHGLRAARRPGFTLIEMVVTLAIVGILAAAAVPLQQLAARRAQEQALRQGLRTLRQALDRFHAEAAAGRIDRAATSAEGWPRRLDDLVNGVPLATGADIRTDGGAATDANRTTASADPGASPPPDSAASPPAPSGPRRLYLLRRLPRDPWADASLPAAATWRVRGSRMAPGHWAPDGQTGDVFDVAPSASGTALDGSRYEDW